MWLVIFWALLNFLHMIFGRNRRGRGRHAVEGAAVGGVVAGAPGAATGAGAGALAPTAGVDSWNSKSYDSARALRDAILLLLASLLLLRLGSNYWTHTVYAVVVAFTVIALLWAFVRGFLHRFADFFAWPILVSFAFYMFYRAFRGDTD